MYNMKSRTKNPVKRNMDKIHRPATHKNKKAYSRKKKLDKRDFF